MKNTKEEKQKLRRYLDDIYTRNEASQLLDSLRDAENKDLLEEVTVEVWEASADHGRTTSAEREEYKKEAVAEPKKKGIIKRTIHWLKSLFKK